MRKSKDHVLKVLPVNSRVIILIFFATINQAEDPNIRISISKTE